MMEKSGGKMAKAGAVSFLFSRRGMIRYDAEKYTEDQIMEVALEVGADDVVVEGPHIVVYCEQSEFASVKEGLDAAELESLVAEVARIPSTSVDCDAALAQKITKLIDKLEDNDDVQSVWGNHEISDEVMNELAQS